VLIIHKVTIVFPLICEQGRSQPVSSEGAISVIFGIQASLRVLSSFWLLNMKRLVILKQQRKKTSITVKKVT